MQNQTFICVKVSVGSKFHTLLLVKQTKKVKNRIQFQCGF